MVKEREMSLSLVQGRALLGLGAASVTVEVHLADVEIKEARGRVRAALQSAGWSSPPTIAPR